MLFNSYEFIFLFLPVAMAGFFLLGAARYYQAAMTWLVLASLFFYGWWNPAYLWLILGSIVFNYLVGIALSSKKLDRGVIRKLLLIGGIGVNLGLIGYYKYANFFVDNVNAISGSDFHLSTIILPLAISFFTFQQVAYLVDSYRHETSEYNFLHYCLFVTFFPQLIAGPIVHHKDMLPQFASKSIYKLQHNHLAIGASIFFLGLFKKVVLADNIAVFGTPVFSAAEQGALLTFTDAWGGALAYTFQLYFDFSGYSDMAIGIARMFGILLPLNFNSPYKATSIVDFWRRWHITLSGFLRDYLYIALGGNRNGKVRRYVNLFLTMLLGGLWHGAGWPFVVWGALHGTYLVINHAWGSLRRAVGLKPGTFGIVGMLCARSLTFLAVIIAWVFFRAESFAGATNILASMAGINGISLPSALAGPMSSLGPVLAGFGVDFEGSNVFQSSPGLLWVGALFLIAWIMPNTQQIMHRFTPALESKISPVTAPPKLLSWAVWKPNAFWALVILGASIYAVASMTQISEFLYFQF